MKYIKQLDALRTFAVLLVIIAHWAPKDFNKLFSFGNLGVNIFFVLSGFLITRIILNEKEDIEKEGIKDKKFSAIGRFMMRRLLRIFPVYYLMLFVLYLGDSYLSNPIQTDLEYYVLYLQNFLYYFRQSFPGGKVGHFWTLAVEEQFYLVWPWILFFVNKKYTKNVMVIGIILGTVSSLLLPLIPGKEILTPALTICCLQSFCFGGLLAYWVVKGDSSLNNNYSFLKRMAITSLTLYVGIKMFYPSFIFFDRLFESIITTWFIALILLDKTSKIDYILSNKILISIGKVSYGVYIFHNFIPVSVKAILHLLNKKAVGHSEQLLVLEFLQGNLIIFNVICMTILLGIAYFSFYFIETPFLKLKRYF